MGSSKEALMESPPVYTDFPFPKIPCCPIPIKKPLCIVLVLVVIVVIVVVAILMGLFMTQKHTESIFQMSILGHDRLDSQLRLFRDRKEGVDTFHVSNGINNSATVVYDYSNLLICYRPWPGQACYITKMDKENIPGLDAITKEFQDTEAKLNARSLRHGAKPDPDDSLGMDRSALGTSIRVLCSGLPLAWA